MLHGQFMWLTKPKQCVNHFSLQGAITKRMTAIEEMAGMDVLCSDKTGTLTLNKLTVDKNLVEVIQKLFSFSLLYHGRTHFSFHHWNLDLRFSQKV